jgi:hypothetical protein
VSEKNEFDAFSFQRPQLVKHGRAFAGQFDAVGVKQDLGRESFRVHEQAEELLRQELLQRLRSLSQSIAGKEQYRVRIQNYLPYQLKTAACSRPGFSPAWRDGT